MKARTPTILTYTALAAVSALVWTSTAGVPGEGTGNKGREFLMSFLPNFVDSGSRQLYLTAEEAVCDWFASKHEGGWVGCIAWNAARL